MGISPQDFRIRIGSFNCTSMKQSCKTKSYSSSVKKFKTKMTFIAPILMLVICLSILAVNSNCWSSSKHSNIKTYKSGNIKQAEINENHISTFCWAQAGLKPNKLQKIINGNRRSLGYKLAVWNCGRGLL
jgi:preprotein translocase subunit SecG